MRCTERLISSVGSIGRGGRWPGSGLAGARTGVLALLGVLVGCTTPAPQVPKQPDVPSESAPVATAPPSAAPARAPAAQEAPRSSPPTPSTAGAEPPSAATIPRSSDRARPAAGAAGAAGQGGAAVAAPPPSIARTSPQAAATRLRTARVSLPAPSTARSWPDFRLQAARRLLQANPGATYDGAVAEPLLAIPVLQVELNADGSVRRIEVLRQPTQARDTVQLAIEAVQRAAPYGAMQHLPRPWKWSEVFLFDDDRRFKPRELDR